MIRVEVDRVADACGFGVPLMQVVGERPQREAWLAKHDDDSLRRYVEQKNSSLDRRAASLLEVARARRRGLPLAARGTIEPWSEH